MNPPYPIPIGGWRVLRRFSVGGWQVVAEAHETAARRAYDGHTRTLGKGTVCLVRPCGTVEEAAVKGGAL